ncbi:MAG: glycosyltransferase [Thiomicrorhabdus chilensis]|uniref:glycosyltransferase n=1 Tax=Thiomicrorhabdus chilensis TaxID=63656 RepID=UPI00299EB1B4|nr:glycosyltransferase [Thiomicrorhabdus chilensis]MDX1347484.1 glycosyltransferase [Thiomicrorhabdus chilensis]
MKQTLLIIGYVWPEPNSSAAGTRMMQLIQLFIKHGFNITFVSPAKLGEHAQDLSQLGVISQAIQLNHASFDDFVQQLSPDIVLFDRFMMEEQFGWRVEKHCPNALRILNTEDLHSLREARQTNLKALLKKTTSSLEALWEQNPQKLFEDMASSDAAQREIASIFRSDLTLMISKFESQLLQQAFQVNANLLFTLPFLYPTPDKLETPGFEQRQNFVFIGNFRHAPNWDSVIWLKQNLWPKIREALPHTELHIYGAYPAKKVTDFHNPKQGFHVQGWAESVWPVMQQARVCLAPLRFGAGIKGKLAEAMLCGTPSITTPIGSEGMLPAESSVQDWPGFIGRTETELVEQAIKLHQNEQAWYEAQQNAIKLGQTQYCETSTGSAMMQAVESIRANLTAHRQHNFIGAMLRHHHHKSTQYMAQWIEAKNK